MTTPEDRLLELARAGKQVTIEGLGNYAAVHHSMHVLAANRFAPLVAETLIRDAGSFAGEEGRWDALVKAFCAGLRDQTSLLAAIDTYDILLASPEVVAVAGQVLHDSALPDTQQIATHPALAGAGLEAVLRVVLLGAASRYQVMATLVGIVQTMSSLDLDDRISRLIGIALDVWNDPSDAAELTKALQVLAQRGAEDAEVELARHALRVAATQTDVTVMRQRLAQAAAAFEHAAGAHESRDDAVSYAAACRAVLAFHDGDRNAIHAAAAIAKETARRRGLLVHGMHQRVWTTPRRQSEFAWHSLAWRLEDAAAAIDDDEFLDTWEALGVILNVYCEDRAVSPSGSQLAPLVAPRIENEIAQRKGMLRQLQRAIDIDVRRPKPTLPREAQTLLAEATRRAAREPHSDKEAHTAADVGPLGQLLGKQQALILLSEQPENRVLFNDLAAFILANSTAGPVLSHVIAGPLLDELLQGLDDNPAFQGDVRVEFGIVVSHTIRFLLWAADYARPYTRALKEGEQKPHERELQVDFHLALSMTPELAGHAGLELSDVATGRADIYTVFNSGRRYLTEVKRELNDASNGSLAAQYSGQAAEYATSNMPLGQLLVLDLTDHRFGGRHLNDSAWVTHRLPEHGATRRSIVVAVVTGNRPTPSQIR